MESKGQQVEGDGGEMAVLSGLPCLRHGWKINIEGRCWELSRSQVLKRIPGNSTFRSQELKGSYPVVLKV